MNARATIKKILFVTVWIGIGCGMLTLLIAAIGKQKRDHCRDYTIQIKATNNNFFVDQQDVVKLLKASIKGEIKGQKKSAFNLQQMEQLLEKNVWIKDAELYFDNQEILHVAVTEREPIARLFTLTGKSFYIDETGKRMPTSEKLAAKIPVFTGFPEKVLGRRDSLLLSDVTKTALFIGRNPFWMAQVAQVDITASREFEMVPVVGNHLVMLGNGEDIPKKFHRLFVFYKNVLSKTGFEKYKTINVQYARQVVGVKDNDNRKDTARLRMNVEKLMRQSREIQVDSVIAARAVREQRLISVDPALSGTEISPIKNTQSVTTNNPVPETSPVPMKPSFKAASERASPEKSAPPKKEPKAVMTKRELEN
ncbi:MAG: hypothetical protein H7Y42_16555 [Chitinophagaceae bacterium]|nr:hypothetical protein [Chitinophagaceae bacterium]